LLILWGVLKLIEYEQAKRYGQPVRGIGVGGVFLILLLVGFGMTATQVSRLNWKGIGEHIQLGDDEDFNEIFGGSTFNYSDELSQDMPAGSTFTSMTTGHGHRQCIRHKDDQVRCARKSAPKTRRRGQL